MTFWVAGAVVVSSYMGSEAAGSAADTQAAAADRSGALQRETAKEQLALQRQIYNQIRSDQAPFRQGGLEAQNRLMTLLGIGGQSSANLNGASPRGGGGGGGSGVAGMIANAIKNSVNPPSGFNVDPNSPDYGKYSRDFGMSDFQADPGYAFRLSEGQKLLDRSAAARGGLISGGALKAAARYGQEMGSQEFTNAYNRYQTNRSNQLNPLQSLMGVGQTSTNALGTAGQNFAGNSANIAQNMASNVGEAYQGAANARASGYVGQANALTGGLGTYLNYSQGQNMINSMRGGGGGGALGGPNNFDPFNMINF